MRSTVWVSLLVAGAATVVLGVLVLRDRPRPAPEEPAPEEPSAPPRVEPVESALRPYETTATLTEDLRDALAGPPEALGAEVDRVSRRLASKARWMLLTGAPEEPSPKVRALLVLAAGAHGPDDEALLAFLGDREPIVRRAAALAAARVEGGTPVELLPGVLVPIGRQLPAATREALLGRLGREEDEGVRGTITAALGS